MFHGGFEWPKNDCTSFARTIEREQWNEWFSFATRNDEPWIVYMTEPFINHCLDVLHKLLDAFGAYCKAHDPIYTDEVRGNQTLRKDYNC
jgi:hypothetical protein